MTRRLLLIMSICWAVPVSLAFGQCSWTLGFGTPVCTGSTYYVPFTCAPGSDPYSSAGQINWNTSRVENIPNGTNVVMTGTLNGCTQSRTCQAPDCGDNPPPPPPPPPPSNLQNITSWVGINTNNNGPKMGEQFWLAVRGKILAEEIRVRTGWADDVFTPGYKLASLPQTEQYIKTHGHLAGIPSAAVVESNGIQVGEMHSLLLRKIEELTLHVIRQQKEIDQLRQRTKRRYP